jgi:hypothetical protein
MVKNERTTVAPGRTAIFQATAMHKHMTNPVIIRELAYHQRERMAIFWKGTGKSRPCTQPGRRAGVTADRLSRHLGFLFLEHTHAMTMICFLAASQVPCTSGNSPDPDPLQLGFPQFPDKEHLPSCSGLVLMEYWESWASQSYVKMKQSEQLQQPLYFS